MIECLASSYVRFQYTGELFDYFDFFQYVDVFACLTNDVVPNLKRIKVDKFAKENVIKIKEKKN